jgi:SAM-dependent methyltransferase
MLHEYAKDSDSRISVRNNESAMKPFKTEQPNSSLMSNKSAGSVRCPLCEKLFDPAHLRECNPGRIRCSCGMVFCPFPVVSVSEGNFWDSSDYSNVDRMEKYYGTERRMGLEECVARATRFVPSGRWLDIGCGVGLLLFLTSERGWESVGIDLSPRAVETARRRGLDAICGCFPDDMPAGKFDVISLVYTVDHLTDPKKMLRGCRDRLNLNGLLVLRVKNFIFWNYAERFFRAKNGIWNPADVANYTPTTIRRLLEAIGLPIVDILPAKLTKWRVLNALFSLCKRLTGLVLSPNMIVMAKQPSELAGDRLSSGLRIENGEACTTN